MREYSESAYVPDSAYAPETKSTVAGIDSAIVITIFAALSFWACVGVAIWWVL